MTSTDNTVVAPWGKWDKISLQLILVGVSCYALFVLAFSTVLIVQSLVSGDRLLSLPVDQPLPAEADAGTATLLDGRLESARVYVTDLTPATTALIDIGFIVGVLTQVVVAASFVYLAFRLLRRRPFMKSLTWTFVVAGAVLLLGSLISQVLSGFGSWLVAAELGSTPDGDSFWFWSFSVDPAPLGFGFALMLVGSAFEYAQKLSRETEGLV